MNSLYVYVALNKWKIGRLNWNVTVQHKEKELGETASLNKNTGPNQKNAEYQIW